MEVRDTVHGCRNRVSFGIGSAEVTGLGGYRSIKDEVVELLSGAYGVLTNTVMF